MNSCLISFDSPEANLACDEVLLELCEEGRADELLRFWEPSQAFVVVGYANRVAREVNLPYCQEQGIPILRRCTGGGTVLQAAGCLNYSLILRIETAPVLQSIQGTNLFILRRLQTALGSLLGTPVEIQGHTDLAVAKLKFCGNAQRRKRHCLLFHGCLLLHADIGLIERALPLPSLQPGYRANRSHVDFLRNLEVKADDVRAALIEAWQAPLPFTEIPHARIAQLASEKYATAEWNLRL